MTEVRAGAKSVFHFDVPGSVAKSTHAGIPISMTLTLLRNGCAEVILTAAWIDFSIQVWTRMKEGRLR